MNDCNHSTSRKQTKPKPNQFKFRVADPNARLSDSAIEVIVRLLLAAPDEVRSETSHPVAA